MTDGVGKAGAASATHAGTAIGLQPPELKGKGYAFCRIKDEGLGCEPWSTGNTYTNFSLFNLTYRKVLKLPITQS